MSSEKTEKDNTPLKHSPFNFPEYVSPTPRPIPIGIKYKPSPLIEYKISTKTECEPIYSHKSPPKSLPNDSPITSKQAELQAQIQKQQAELQFLQTQLTKLQIEKKKQITPENEKNKSIVFDPSVQIMNQTKDNTIDLTDKNSISSIRSKRDLTPYKPKSKLKNLTATNNRHNQSSRLSYRTTPIPHKPKRRIVFKPELQTIEHNKENISVDEDEDISTQLINDSYETPQDNKKLKFAAPKYVTPTKESVNETNTKEFTFGNTPASVPTQSPNVSLSGSVIFQSALTPVKGQGKTPFHFKWNKENNQ